MHNRYDIDLCRMFRSTRMRLLTSSATVMLNTGLFLWAATPDAAQAACSASGALASGSTVTCTGTQTTRVGQGPGADNVSVTVKNGATVSATNTAAISLHDNATVTLGPSGPTPGSSASNAPVVVQVTTNSGAGPGT